MEKSKKCKFRPVFEHSSPLIQQLNVKKISSNNQKRELEILNQRKPIQEYKIVVAPEDRDCGYPKGPGGIVFFR
ncbi:MAG: hypothetical protein KKE44_05745 [Proteobacteria bacterium]|nr:hypothetical protein [Pseudomonadota bacterium]MBU1582232.1 hypothetical protein [Pseudomonadota bacterium]MBU2455382.1 hypothetical protein [Pseudomonadota bacterium]MBU2628442.1 hypothetical protein [Pseudomonadota bacterium]